MGSDGKDGGDGTRALDQTPTWAVVSVCTVIIVASILPEGILHHLGQWFSTRKKKALFDALEKVKSELMTLGFISLLLTITTRYISRICIPEGAVDTMLPCSLSSKSSESEGHKDKGHGRRHLSADLANFSCPKDIFHQIRWSALEGWNPMLYFSIQGFSDLTLLHQEVAGF